MELVLRFLIGGAVVSLFALIGDVFRPKSFAGLFGSAPSIALASLVLCIHSEGKTSAALESRSMIGGAIAFFLYASLVSWMMMRFKTSALRTTAAAVPLWLLCAFSLWLWWWR